MQTSGTPYELPIQNITSYVPNVVISDTWMLIHISGPLWFPEVKWVTDPCGTGPSRGQGLRLPYGRRITILTLVGLDRDLETVFPAFVVIAKIVPPPAGMVPVHAEGASLGAPDSPPNGIPNPLRSSGIKLDSACNGMAFIQTRASTKYRCDNCRNRIIDLPR